MKKSRLLPMTNLRANTPRVCGTCAYGEIDDGTFQCLRPGGYNIDCGDLDHWLVTCDGYKLNPGQTSVVRVLRDWGK